jgi:hypothetical protein
MTLDVCVLYKLIINNHSPRYCLFRDVISKDMMNAVYG